MQKLVIWGHHLDEYQNMFSLSQKELKGPILEYGGGPSAFNVELSRDTAVVSCDPLFVEDLHPLKKNVLKTFDEMSERLKALQNQFDFTQCGGIEALIKRRRDGVDAFLNDYEQGRAGKRYLPLQETTLPFDDFSFELALSANYLFTGLQDQSLDTTLEVIFELCRVAKEVRIFPLIDTEGHPTPYLGPILLKLQQDNFGTEVREVPYHLQYSGNAMLRIWAQQCQM